MRFPFLPLIFLCSVLCVAESRAGEAALQDSRAMQSVSGEDCSRMQMHDRRQGRAPAEEDVACNWMVLYESIDNLPEEQRIKAAAIVNDSLPRLQELDGRILGKVDELQSLTFSDNADPQALPKLGLDLQRLRRELLEALAAVNLRLQQEVGLELLDTRGRGCQSMRLSSPSPSETSAP